MVLPIKEKGSGCPRAQGFLFPDSASARKSPFAGRLPRGTRAADFETSYGAGSEQRGVTDVCYQVFVAYGDFS